MHVRCHTVPCMVEEHWAASCSAFPEQSDTCGACRATAAPAALLVSVSQGVFRGLQDMRTPLGVTVATNILHLGLSLLFIFQVCNFGVRIIHLLCWGDFDLVMSCCKSPDANASK